MQENRRKTSHLDSTAALLCVIMAAHARRAMERDGICRRFKDIAVMKLCLSDACALLTFVSLLSNLYSVSSVFPKSEFLIMPNMSPRPGHLSSLRSFGDVRLSSLSSLSLFANNFLSLAWQLPSVVAQLLERTTRKNKRELPAVSRCSKAQILPAEQSARLVPVSTDLSSTDAFFSRFGDRS